MSYKNKKKPADCGNRIRGFELLNGSVSIEQKKGEK